MLVFVDANIYLNLVRTSNENSISLNSFKKLIENGTVRLLLPQITQDEFFRNLNNIKIDYLKYLDDQIPNIELAVSLRDSDEGKKVLEAQKDFEAKIIELSKYHEKNIDKLIEDTIEKLINKSENFETTKEVLEKAKIRKNTGNPPGKIRDPLGDEIVWELILKYSTNDDVSIVSFDDDWTETPKSDKINPVLQREWDKKSGKEIKCYKTLSEFVKKYDNDITSKEIKDEKASSKPYKFGDILRSMSSGASGSAFAGTLSSLPSIKTCPNCGYLVGPTPLLSGGNTYYCQVCNRTLL